MGETRQFELYLEQKVSVCTPQTENFKNFKILKQDLPV